MSGAPRQILAIARNAMFEILRAPVFCLILATALLVAGVLPTIDYLSFLEKRRLVADSLLALTWCAGALAASLGAVAVVGDEIRRRTALLVLSKPVSRGAWVVGKFLGLAGALALLWSALGAAVLWGSRVAVHDYWPDTFATRSYFLVLAVAPLLAAGVHWRTGKSFALTASLALAVGMVLGFALLGHWGYRGRPGPGWELVDWAQVPAVLMAYPAMLLIGCVAVVASLRLEAVPTLLVAATVFAVGLTSDYFFGRHAGGSVPAALAYAVVPNLQPFWLAERLAEKRPVSAGYLWTAAGYAAAYAGALLAVALAGYERRELA